uniref:Uncharacterized protein n=1 Tax=Cannabis sativa TaxID=3483 RepID=A0A803NM54_CANSA
MGGQFAINTKQYSLLFLLLHPLVGPSILNPSSPSFLIGPYLGLKIRGPLTQRQQFALIKPAAVREVKNSQWSLPFRLLHVDGGDKTIYARALNWSPVSCGPDAEELTRVDRSLSREWRK